MQMENVTDAGKVTEQIKVYLKRLGAGEPLEEVRADFKKNMKEVDAILIMKAEQELLREGTPLEEVQRLCDVHAALFQGATREEQIANAEKAIAGAVKERRLTATKALVAIPGHPLYTFSLENRELEKVIKECRDVLQGETVSPSLLKCLRELDVHYAKKGDLLYPHLKVKYEISGPSDVMWTVDDEIRAELSALSKQKEQDEKWKERFAAALKRAEDMIYKEENILFPNCALNFTKEEWYGIYQDSKDYETCLQVKNEKWEEAEQAKAQESAYAKEDEIVLVGGHMTVEQLNAMLTTIPLEITFVDSSDINRFFNAGSKVFKRPAMAIDREVYSCHPPKIEQQVRRIIGEFKAGTLDKVPIWMDKNGKTFLVTYMAVRDGEGNYIGTMELVQDMEFAKEYFTK